MNSGVEFEEFEEFIPESDEVSVFTSPKDAEREIGEILKNYIRDNSHDPSSWEGKARSALICFRAYFDKQRELTALLRRGPITTYEIYQYVAENVANLFIHPLQEKLGSKGNSVLRNKIIKCADSWNIDPKEFTKKKITLR